MSPRHWQSLAQILEELIINVITLYKWRKVWRLQGEKMPESSKTAEGWCSNEKFTVVLESAGLSAPELGK